MLKKIVCLLAFAGVITAAQAQSKLGDLVAEAGVDWLVGDWQAETDSGDTVFISLKADLDNRVGFIHFKDRRSESKGIVVLDPISGEAKYYSGNNRGDAGTGVWTAEDNKAILKYKHTSADGNTTRMGLVFSKVNANTMRVALHELSEKDVLGEGSRGDLEFKRKK